MCKLLNNFIKLFNMIKRYGISRYAYRNSISVLDLCKSGDLNELKTRSGYDLNKGLIVAVEYNNREIVEYLINEGANNLDEGLRQACHNNFYDISELLVKKGANIVVGLRVAKSPNIIRMLYRYEQRSDNIM